MSKSKLPKSSAWRILILTLVVFAVVLAGQLWLVRAAGTDIPFHDQWDVEGRWLYPAWLGGSFCFQDLLRPHNEHRIFWTHLLNLGLFDMNGQWDPLVQLIFNAGLHALIAGLVTVFLVVSFPPKFFGVGAAFVAGICLPVAGWHNALWGFQSQVYFSILFAMPALAWLPRSESRLPGVACALAAMLAMGSGVLVPAALLVMLLLRTIENRGAALGWKSELTVLLALSGVGFLAETAVVEHALLRSNSAGDFLKAWTRMLAWPHHYQPLSAVVLNLPLVAAISGRLGGWRKAVPGENAVMAIGVWVALITAAAAWTRGGGAELATGVPSRYVDFIVLLVLANAWCLVAWVRTTNLRVRWVVWAWAAFFFVGWLGVSSEMLRRVILPLTVSREISPQLTRAYQLSGEANVFSGQPRLLIPHPHLSSVRAVLDDPRMSGALPPSLQPERPQGPLSRAARWLLGR